MSARKRCQNLSTVTRAGKVKWRSRKNKRKYEVDNMHMHVQKKKRKKKEENKEMKEKQERDSREGNKKMLSIFELRDLNTPRTWFQHRSFSESSRLSVCVYPVRIRVSLYSLTFSGSVH